MNARTVSILAALFVTAPVFAGDGNTVSPFLQEVAADREFSAVDDNGDGRINPSEAQGAGSLGSRFDAFDGNNNGHIGRSEYDLAISTQTNLG